MLGEFGSVFPPFWLPLVLPRAPFWSDFPATKVGTAECAERLNLTSRGNGKRSLESAVKMLIADSIFGICYFVLVFIAICSDMMLFDAT